MIENNRLISNPDWKGDKRAALETGELQKQAIKEHEESWQRMGCASILHGK